MDQAILYLFLYEIKIHIRTKNEVKTAKNAPNPKITEYPTP